MHCAEFDNLLAPLLDGELMERDRALIDGHLAACDRCASRTAAERELHAALRSAARSANVPAPPQLVERTMAGIRRERSRRARRSGLAAAVATSTALVLGGVAHQQWRTFQRRLHLEDAAARHARNYPLEIQQPSTESLEAWFGGKLDHRVSVPRFANATATGARLLNVREKPAAYIRYELAPAGRMGLFVYGDVERQLDVAPIDEARVDTTRGYSVASWREGDVVYELVTDLEDERLRSLLPSLRRAHAAPPPGPARPSFQTVSFER